MNHYPIPMPTWDHHFSQLGSGYLVPGSRSPASLPGVSSLTSLVLHLHLVQSPSRIARQPSWPPHRPLHLFAPLPAKKKKENPPPSVDHSLSCIITPTTWSDDHFLTAPPTFCFGPSSGMDGFPESFFLIPIHHCLPNDVCKNSPLSPTTRSVTIPSGNIGAVGKTPRLYSP